MRNVKNTIVKKIAVLALAVGGMGFASSQASAQDAQCATGSIAFTCTQPVTYVRNLRSRSHEDSNALRESMESVGSRLQAEMDSSPQWVTVNFAWQKATADVQAEED